MKRIGLRSRAQLIGIIFVLGIVCIFLYRAALAQHGWDSGYLPAKLAIILTDEPGLLETIALYHFDGPERSGAVGEYDLELAEQAYLRMLEVGGLPDRKVAEARYQLARISFISSEFEQAIGRTDHVIAAGADSQPQVYYLRGLLFGFVGDLHGGIKEMQHYIDLTETTDWYAYNNLAWLHFQLGEYYEAKRAVTEVLPLYPDNPWLLMSLGTAELNLGDKVASRAALEAAASSAARLTPADWSRTYPGNNPQIAVQGLEELRATINKNLYLVDQ